MTTLEKTRSFWNANVSNWKVATHNPDSLEFFLETEKYRFEKLHYLAELVDFNSFSGQRLLDLGCGLGNDTARFAAGGADVTGIDISDRAIALSTSCLLYTSPSPRDRG